MSNYTYSFDYDAREDGFVTSVGNFLESDVRLHILPGEEGYDESYLDLEERCEKQVKAERPGVHVRAVDIVGVTEPNGEFYYLPDHTQEI